MTRKYLKYIPKTLQEDFVNNRVIPFVGAGFSKNAIAPEGVTILDWEELGRKVATYIPNYSYTSAIDALSLFESEFSRVKLIELLAKELHINELMPGQTHRSLCDLYFDIICTTNFDFLIEQTMNEKHIPFSTIVSEKRLPIDTSERTKLIKLHGDFNNPDKMIITEYDYDTFIKKNKILSTFVSNLFITRTLLIIGYSFDDSDIRTLWQIINSRLGELTTPAYVVLVDASPLEIARFERRNIKVINLPGNKKNYSSILYDFFKEIKQIIDEKTPEKMLFTTERATEELIMPQTESRLCFISSSYERISFLKELLYPVLNENDFSPITLDEAVMPGELITRKIDALISKSTMAIIDLSNNNNIMWEFENIVKKQKKCILIVEENQITSLPLDIQKEKYLIYRLSGENKDFICSLRQFLNELNVDDGIMGENRDYFRLFEKAEYDAAVIAAFRFLEIELSERFKYNGFNSLIIILEKLCAKNFENVDILNKVKSYVKIRNNIIHTNATINKKQAKEIITDINTLSRLIKNDNIHL